MQTIESTPSVYFQFDDSANVFI